MDLLDLNLNVHLHPRILDGVFTRPTPTTFPAPPKVWCSPRGDRHREGSFHTQIRSSSGSRNIGQCLP
jgi:hypothetical protein